MIIPVQEKPFPKKDLPQILKRQQTAWFFVSTALPPLSILTLFLFTKYAGYSGNALIYSVLLVQIIYSVYLTRLLKGGIKTDKSQLQKYKNNKMIYFTKIVDKSQLNSYYVGIILFGVFVALTIFLN